MIVTRGHNQQALKKCLSYNDLKKRRMMRSNSNKGCLVPIKDKSTSTNESKISSLAGSNLNYVTKISKIVKQIQARNLPKLSEKTTEPTEKGKAEQEIKNDENLNTNNLGCKRNRSLRILTKKTILRTNFNATIRPAADLMKRIEGENRAGLVQTKADLAKKYNTVPHSLDVPVTQQATHFLDTISPIQAKGAKDLPHAREQISGFSLVFDIEEAQKPVEAPVMFHIDDYTLRQPLEAEVRMPKLMKKHLPKDFFLRV